MRPSLCLGLCLLGAPALAADLENWPTKVTFGDDVELAATANFAWDSNDFSGDARLEDDDAMRRREFGATLRKKGVFDAMVYYDFEAETWLDVYLRLETKALFGRDWGKVRVGYMKVPVGLEGVTSSRADSFLETALPVQAIYQGRRTGVEWTFERPAYLLQAGGYAGHDLHGDNPGQTLALRGVWTPVKAEGDVLHLGLALSRETPEGFDDGRGVHFRPNARLRARPEAGLTEVRLVDSGSLAPVDHVQRAGLEGIWIRGPFSLQGEALQARVTRQDGLGDYDAQGQYAFASWMLTGESRPYAAGNVANPKPRHGYGAVELLARYSRLDLDDGGLDGGRQHDTTLGVNWYLTSHFKLQANYVRADASRRGVHTTPEAVEFRAQVQF